MRHCLLVLYITFGIAFNTRAQFFVELQGGVLLPIGGSSVAISTSSSQPLSRLINCGQGRGGLLVLGHEITDAIGLEARFGYIAGPPHNPKESIYGNREETIWWKEYFRFDAALRFTSSGDKTRGYIAVGPSFAFAPKLEYSRVHSYQGMNEEIGTYDIVTETTNNYSGGTGYGGFGAFGVMSKIGGAFHFFCELQVTAMDWAPKKLQYDQIKTNEQSWVVQYGPSGITRFVEKVDESDEATKVHMAMSTWGFNFGVRYTFKKADRPPVPGP